MPLSPLRCLWKSAAFGGADFKLFALDGLPTPVRPFAFEALPDGRG